MGSLSWLVTRAVTLKRTLTVNPIYKQLRDFDLYQHIEQTSRNRRLLTVYQWTFFQKLRHLWPLKWNKNRTLLIERKNIWLKRSSFSCIEHPCKIVYKKTDKWYSEWQRVTTSDNEWQRMTTNNKEWQRVTISANFLFFSSKRGVYH